MGKFADVPQAGPQSLTAAESLHQRPPQHEAAHTKSGRRLTLSTKVQRGRLTDGKTVNKTGRTPI